MQSPTPAGDAATARAPEELLAELDRLLSGAGFRVEVDPRHWAATVQNPRAAQLRQVVRLGGRDGEPWWFWEWSGAGRGDPPEYQPMCPAQRVEDAAGRVSRVLRLADALPATSTTPPPPPPPPAPRAP